MILRRVLLWTGLLFTVAIASAVLIVYAAYARQTADLETDARIVDYARKMLAVGYPSPRDASG